MCIRLMERLMFSHQLIHAPGVSYVMGTLAQLLLGLKNLNKNTSLTKEKGTSRTQRKCAWDQKSLCCEAKEQSGQPKGRCGQGSLQWIMMNFQAALSHPTCVRYNKGIFICYMDNIVDYHWLSRFNSMSPSILHLQ